MSVNSVNGSSGTTGASSSSTNTASQASGIDALANENTFLKLFIAQLKNQDPLNPQDGTQFVAQLAQFSNLEQVIQMRSDISAIKSNLEKYTAGASGATDSTNTNKG